MAGENKTIFDFINESAIKANDEIPFWRVLPDGSGTSSRVSFSEFVASLPGSQAEAPVEMVVTTASTPLDLLHRRFYVLTLGSGTELMPIRDAQGRAFETGRTVDVIFVSTELRTVTFSPEFNHQTSLSVVGKVGVRFKAISSGELVPVAVGAGGGGSAKLKRTLEVAGTTWGGIRSGDVFPAGTDIEDILFKGLRVAGKPTYLAPKATLSVTGSQAQVEAGSTVDVLLRASYTRNDAGQAQGCTFYKNGVVLNATPDTTEPFEFDEAAYTIGEETVEYNAVISYRAGAVKNNALGEPDPDGQIPAGEVSTPVAAVKGLRKLFFGFDKDTLNSGAVRSLQNDLLAPVKGQTFAIHIPAGTRRVHFAYPASLGNVASVQFKEGLMAEVRDVYDRQVVAVEGANGYAAVNYYVYTFTPVTPFEANYTHIVTI